MMSRQRKLRMVQRILKLNEYNVIAGSGGSRSFLFEEESKLARVCGTGS